MTLPVAEHFEGVLRLIDSIQPEDVEAMNKVVAALKGLYVILFKHIDPLNTAKEEASNSQRKRDCCPDLAFSETNAVCIQCPSYRDCTEEAEK